MQIPMSKSVAPLVQHQTPLPATMVSKDPLLERVSACRMVHRTRRVEQRGYLEEQKELIRAHIEDLEAENNEIATDIARIQRDFTGLLAWCVEYRMLTAEQIQSITGPQQESK
ncbi:hypothetical protein HPB50_018319 [Hyalomma asiaticum]|uniref:Uncharacterized protein n=1 Tax=Hyalomma asiaticum TaxID=266040 RepID=A0ACB7RJU5_HYAAI|nr:hypothetical protein HPB50_018319 [Hyalomma asiaticum]